MIIYKITNLINNKIYIGQTIQTLNKRINRHFSDAETGNKTTPLYLAIKKYGKINFKIDIIDNAESIEQLNEKEIYWIKYYNCTNRDIGYNMTHGGDRGVHTLEVRKIIADKIRGTKYSDERKKRMSEKRKGYKLSEETKAKISKANKGKLGQTFSEEQKLHLSNIQKQKYKEGKVKINIGFIDITKEQLEEQFLLDINIDNICKNLNVSETVIQSRAKKYWGKSAAKVRKELLDAKNRNS